MKQSNNRGI